MELGFAPMQTWEPIPFIMYHIALMAANLEENEMMEIAAEQVSWICANATFNLQTDTKELVRNSCTIIWNIHLSSQTMPARTTDQMGWTEEEINNFYLGELTQQSQQEPI